MAVDLTLKSTAITNREATPAVHNNPGAGGVGIVKQVYGYYAAVPASLSLTSIIRMVEVPSNAVVTSVRANSDAQTAGAFDIGVYRTNRDGGAVVSQAFFTAALNCASAFLDQECLTKATSLNTIAKRGQPLWQAVGLSADPKCMLDIALTVATTAVTTGTGAVSLLVTYVA
jgi:hypothetical protein